MLQGTITEWRSVFYLWGGIFAFGATFFIIFAEGETQTWAKADDDYVKEDVEKNVN